MRERKEENIEADKTRKGSRKVIDRRKVKGP